MFGVDSLSTTVEITFILPNNILKNRQKSNLTFELKGLYSDKLSGDSQIFQFWPYLNSWIIIRLTLFCQQEHVQFLPLLSPNKTCALPFNFPLERDLKNIFYYQHGVENYTDQVLNFSLFDRHEYIKMESSNL